MLQRYYIFILGCANRDGSRTPPTPLVAVLTPSLQLNQCFITCRQPAASTSTLQSSIDIVDRTAFRLRAKLLIHHQEKSCHASHSTTGLASSCKASCKAVR